MFTSDGSVDRKYIANYASLQVRERLLRTPGVGDVNTNAARDYAMRVWIDPERAAARDLTVQEIVAALRNNNLQVAGGAVGAPPFNDNPAAYQLNIRAQGRLDTPEEFAGRDHQARRAGPRHAHRRRRARGARRAELRDQRVQEPRARRVAAACSRRRTPTRSRPWDNIRAHDGGAEAGVPAGRRVRDHLQPVLVHARRRGSGAARRCSRR